MSDADLPRARVGQVLGGKYQLVRLIAEGGMGWVFEARHELVKRRFAVKLLRPALAHRRDLLARFRDEAVAAGALESEHVAAALDLGFADDGVPYLVMEYLQGETVAALLAREGRLPPERAVDLVAQACEGVAVAHAAGILHRDLKPQNLFVSRRADGTDLVKVLDFGVAKLEDAWRDGESPTETGAGHGLGTPAYMSPEQARGEPTLDGRSDLHALAAILYELLAGVRPHRGTSGAALLHQIATQAPVSLATHLATLPADLVTTIDEALALEPNARPAGVAIWRERLRPFETRRAWPPVPEGPPPAAATTLQPSGDRAVHPPRGRRMGRVAVALLVGGLGVAAWGLLRKSTGGAPATPRARAFPASARFFVPPPRTGAVQQISGLVRAGAVDKAALLTALEAVPRALWFTQGSPTDVEDKVRATTARATHAGTVPVLVASNIPFRDCAQDSAGGTSDNASYGAWIAGFARGVGHQRALVILEPDSLGIIPYNKTLEGAEEWCKPTVLDAKGHPIAAPGADPGTRYAALRRALAQLRAECPGAAVYLDATHAAWVPVPEIAYRLARAGVQDAQGFVVNVAATQTTQASLAYGTAISRCLSHAAKQPGGGQEAADYVGCLSERLAEEVPLIPFVIDTSRNGRGPFVAARYADAPFRQPPAVLEALAKGNWCNPPGVGLGLQPTTSTGVPWVDAFVWVKPPGESDGSCDLAGGTRAWDYERHNPWNLSGEAARHFDPLWGMVDPAGGEWFPEQALELALNASPPLMGAAPPQQGPAQ